MCPEVPDRHHGPREKSAAQAPLLVAMSLGQPQLPRPNAVVLRHYFYTALIVMLCGAVGFVAHALTLTEANIIMIFLAGVAFVAARFGRGPAIFAAVFGVLVFDFFFVVPFLSFALSDAQYVVTFLVMLGYALAGQHVGVAAACPSIRRATTGALRGGALSDDAQN